MRVERLRHRPRRDGRALAEAPISSGIPCSRAADCTSGICFDDVCGLPAGQACTLASQCITGPCAEGTCGAKPDGSPCTGPGDCQSAVCAEGTCGLKANRGSVHGRRGLPVELLRRRHVRAQGGLLGAPCASDDACTSGACLGGTCHAQLPNAAPCAGDSECVSGLCEGVCSCIGPGTVTTAAETCCSGSLQAYTDCDDPVSPCILHDACDCQDGVGNPICCGLPDGNSGCAPSDGMACAVSATCDPDLACGGAGTCCALPGGQDTTSCCSGWSAGGTCGCTEQGSACQAGGECCSGTCSNGTCTPDRRIVR